MDNVFDQFDEQSDGGGNVFDQFDEQPSAAIAPFQRTTGLGYVGVDPERPLPYELAKKRMAKQAIPTDDSLFEDKPEDTRAPQEMMSSKVWDAMGAEEQAKFSEAWENRNKDQDGFADHWDLGTKTGADAMADEFTMKNMGRQVMRRFGATGTGLLEVAAGLTGSETLKELAQTDTGWGAQNTGSAEDAYGHLKAGRWWEAFKEYIKVGVDTIPGELAHMPLYMTGVGAALRGGQLAKAGAHAGVATGTWASLTGMLAKERAEKQGREGEITGEDWMWAGTGAALSYITEKLGVDFLRKLGGGKLMDKLSPEMAADVKGIMGAAAKAGVAVKGSRTGRSAIGAVAEGAQEFVQEGIIESLATSYGTKDWESKDLEARIDDMLTQGLAGAVAGGGIGVGVGAISTDPYKAEKAALKAAQEDTVEGADETGVVGPTKEEHTQAKQEAEMWAAREAETQPQGVSDEQAQQEEQMWAEHGAIPVKADTRQAEGAALSARKSAPKDTQTAPRTAAISATAPSSRPDLDIDDDMAAMMTGRTPAAAAAPPAAPNPNESVEEAAIAAGRPGAAVAAAPPAAAAAAPRAENIPSVPEPEVQQRNDVNAVLQGAKPAAQVSRNVALQAEMAAAEGGAGLVILSTANPDEMIVTTPDNAQRVAMELVSGVPRHETLGYEQDVNNLPENAVSVFGLAEDGSRIHEHAVSQDMAAVARENIQRNFPDAVDTGMEPIQQAVDNRATGATDTEGEAADPSTLFTDEELKQMEVADDTAFTARSVQRLNRGVHELAQSRKDSQGRPGVHAVLEQADEAWSELRNAYKSLGRQGKDVTALREFLDYTNSYDGIGTAAMYPVTGGIEKSSDGTPKARRRKGATDKASPAKRIERLFSGEGQRLLRAAYDSTPDPAVVEHFKAESASAGKKDAAKTARKKYDRILGENQDVKDKLHSGKAYILEHIETNDQYEQLLGELRKIPEKNLTKSGRYKMPDVKKAVDNVVGVEQEEVVVPENAKVIEEQIEEQVNEEIPVDETPTELSDEEKAVAEARAAEQNKDTAKASEAAEAKQAGEASGDSAGASVEEATFEGAEVEVGGSTSAQEGEIEDTTNDIAAQQEDAMGAFIDSITDGQLREMNDVEFRELQTLPYVQKRPELQQNLVERRNEQKEAARQDRRLRDNEKVHGGANDQYSAYVHQDLTPEELAALKEEAEKVKAERAKAAKADKDSTTAPVRKRPVPKGGKRTGDRPRKPISLRPKADKDKQQVEEQVQVVESDAIPPFLAVADDANREAAATDPDSIHETQVRKGLIRGLYKGVTYTIENVRKAHNGTKAMWEAFVGKTEVVGENTGGFGKTQAKTSSAVTSYIDDHPELHQEVESSKSDSNIQTAEEIRSSLQSSERALLDNPLADDIMMARASAEMYLDDAIGMEGDIFQSEDVISILMQPDVLHPQDPLRGVIVTMMDAGVFDGDLPTTFVTPAQIAEMGITQKATGWAQRWQDIAGADRGVYLNKRTFGSGEGVRTLVHEYIHFATVTRFKSDKAFNKRVNKLYHMALQVAADRGQGFYGLTNVREFLAEAMTNAEFQNFLNSIEVSQSAGSIWQRLVDAIGKMLGMDVNLNSVLADTIRVTTNNMQSYNQALVGDMEMAQRLGLADAEAIQDFNRELAEPETKREKVDSALTATSKVLAGKPVDSRTVGTGMRKAQLALSTQDQIVRTHASKFDTQDSNGKPVNWLKRHYQIMMAKVAYARGQQKKAESISRMWRLFQSTEPKRAKLLDKVMERSTMQEFHIDKTLYHSDNAHVLAKKSSKVEAKFEKLQEDFRALGPQGQKIYREVQAFYKQQRKDLRVSTIEHILKSNKMHPDQLREAKEYANAAAAKRLIDADGRNQIEDEEEFWKWLGTNGDKLKDSLKDVVSKTELRGPYFPLRRFGNHVVEGIKQSIVGEFMTQKAAIKAQNDWLADNPSAESVVRKDKNGKFRMHRKEREVHFFEDASEAARMAKALEDDGFLNNEGGEGILPTLKEDWQSSGGVGGNAVLGEAIRKVDNPALKAQLETAYLNLLAENSMKHSERRRRKGVEGASLDMHRGFAERAFAGSWAIADSMTAFDNNEALKGIASVARSQTAASNVDEATMLGLIRDEILARETKAMQDRSVSWVDSLSSKVGFFWFLSTPSYAMVNATQPVLVALPYLTAKYGTKGSKILFDQMAELSRYGAKGALATVQNPAKVFDDMKSGEAAETFYDKMYEAIQDPDVRAMLDELSARGRIDATFAQELYKASQGQDRNWSDSALDFARAAPAMVEIINRVVVSKAAYQLELGKLTKGNPDSATDAQKAAAIEAADEAVLRTQFDYSDMNKPRWFKAFPGVRAIMMFKMYAQGMYALMGGAAVDLATGRNNNRLEAASMLGLLTVSHGLAAGAGQALVEPARIMLEMLMNALRDDDEEEWKWKNAVRDNVFEFFSDTMNMDDKTSAYWADIVTNGAPRMLGVDVSTRLGIDNLAWREGPDSRSHQDAGQAFLIQLIGPMGGLYMNAMRGWDYFDKGEYQKGAEAVAPKFFRDVMRAHRVSDEGMTDYNGKVIAQPRDLNSYAANMGLGVVGFGDATQARVYEGRERKKASRNRKADRARSLRNQWMRQSPDERMNFYREHIVPYNMQFPDSPITVPSLFKSLGTRRKEEATTRGGYFSKDPSVRQFDRMYTY